MDSSHPSQILPRQSTNLKKNISNAPGANQVDPAQQISQTFNKLHETIDNLDSKVQTLMDKHEIQFLFAWQNHIKKIKNELKQIKDRSEEKQRLMNSNERMVAMQKQMALFRDESLRLYDEVEDNKNEIEVLRRRLKEQDLELEILREENKELVKSIKMAEAKFVVEHERLVEFEKELEKYRPSAENSQKATLQMVTVDPKNMSSKNMSIMQTKTIGFGDFNLQAIRSTENTGLNYQKKTSTMMMKQAPGHENYSISKLKQQKLNRLSVTNKWQTNGFDKSGIVEEQSSEIKKKNSLPVSNKSITKTHYHNFMMIEPSIYDSELKNWFLECIRSIKKQISSRKSGFTSPAVDIMKVTSLEEFKTIDKLRLLEMFLENEKLLVYMYQKIFPDRLKEIEAYLGQKVVKNHGENQTNRIIANDNVVSGHERKEDKGSLDADLLQDEQSGRPRNESKIRVKSVSKASKSQPIRNRIIMRDGKLNLIF